MINVSVFSKHLIVRVVKNAYTSLAANKLCHLTSRIWTPPPKYKKLINSSGAWNKPVVDYPASGVESIVFRADMEFA